MPVTYSLNLGSTLSWSYAANQHPPYMIVSVQGTYLYLTTHPIPILRASTQFIILPNLSGKPDGLICHRGYHETKLQENLDSEIFGVLIACIACYEGLSVTGGAEGVGRATTNAVVRSIVGLILCDLLFTAVFFVFL